MEAGVWIVVQCMGFCVKRRGWSFGMRRVGREVLRLNSPLALYLDALYHTSLQQTLRIHLLVAIVIEEVTQRLNTTS